MFHLPLSHSGARQSQDGISSSKHSSAVSIQQQQQQRASLDVRIDAGAGAGSAAKARMLWREGFTPLEMENSQMDEREVRRQEVMFEVIHTEADYVKDLRIIVEVLQRPMQELRLAAAEEIELVFGNIGEILELHSELNAALMERQRQQYPVVWDISDVLARFVGRLRIYARYICNQDKALGLVDRLRKTSNNFEVFWRERQQRGECRKLPLEAFLVLPFQRLLKYPLLLRALLAATGEHTEQYARARAVADQIDGWINKIQDARAKLDGMASLEALARGVAGVEWAGLLGGEHRLAHSGTVRVGDEDATLWLFDAFLVIARPPAVVLAPSRAVDVLDVAQCRGAPALLVHAEPVAQPGPRASVMVRFATRAEHGVWRAKLNAHVRAVLAQRAPAEAADELAAAVARTTLGEADLDAPMSISVRDVYVHFPPAPRERGKLRRGWDFLCSKTEDLTGHGIKRQLRKYGGGGGKRRATDAASPQSASAAAVPSPRVISTPILAQSAPALAQSQSSAPGLQPGTGLLSPVPLTSYARYSCRMSAESSPASQRPSGSSETVVLEVVSATLACGGSDGDDAPMRSAGTEATGKTLPPANARLPLPPALLATLPMAKPRPSPKPLPPIPARARVRKPAPVFEVGSAKLTYGRRSPKLRAAHVAAMPMPLFPPAAAAANTPWRAEGLRLAPAPRVFNQPSLARGWQVVDAEDPPLPSAASTDSFCIVSHDPHPVPPTLLPTSTRQGAAARRAASSRLLSSAAHPTTPTFGSRSIGDEL
ncbi:Rho guanine nucleotide exchange factor 3 [Coemansia thaxteri]|uniref:Rho guanine nucleotide exchange factor 3 n=1 Tax=Coemansia thaxteri TaxID=2663907 RepID=A0A9W8BFK2_9FUNG|nr:Rho guanine nucleotide exchange factor 3 [Coemansia thaxteri]KAJ2008399.1 Rho guanine nucleotide exchange factor 3 [Coemansia thaxteri]KAJ2481882.1 Rho guanine nucleotide exchange factor 3 [Coemansia sp. RSA 2320]